MKTLGFAKIGPALLATVSTTNVAAGDSIYLPASAIHTVAVAPNSVAAWLVFEGREDPAYRPICYSTADLEKEDLTGLYKPMGEEELRRVLNLAGLIS